MIQWQGNQRNTASVDLEWTLGNSRTTSIFGVVIYGSGSRSRRGLPDFIPVLGYLDDLVLVPAGILLVRRLIPAELLAEHRATADRVAERPTSRTAAVVIAGVWLAAIALTVWLAWPLIGARLSRARWGR